jgi:hypothetical protein
VAENHVHACHLCRGVCRFPKNTAISLESISSIEICFNLQHYSIVEL